MSVHFSRSLRTLDTDNSRRSAVLFIFIIGFLGLWFAWFLAGRVAVYASTGAARLEVARENHPVDAAVEGRVDAVRVVVGQWVQAGKVLLEFDARSERLARGEEQARLAPAASQANLLREELAAQQLAIEEERRSAKAAIAQSEAEGQRAKSSAAFAAEESNRVVELQRRGLISQLEALRAKNGAAERQNDAQAAEFASRRVSLDLGVLEQDRPAQIARESSHWVAAPQTSRTRMLGAPLGKQARWNFLFEKSSPFELCYTDFD